MGLKSSSKLLGHLLGLAVSLAIQLPTEPPLPCDLLGEQSLVRLHPLSLEGGSPDTQTGLPQPPHHEPTIYILTLKKKESFNLACV